MANDHPLSKVDHLKTDFSIFESRPGIAFVLTPNAPNYSILSVSNDCQAFTGMPRQFVTNKTIFDVFPINPEEETPEDQTLSFSLHWVLQHKKQHQFSLSHHTSFVNGSGFAPKHWQVTNTPVLDAIGDVTYIILTVEDVTLQVQAQKTEAAHLMLAQAFKKIEESEQNLRNTILQAPVAMCIFRGADYVVEVANERMFQIWGKERDAVLGKPVFEAIPEARNQGFEAMLQQVEQTGIAATASEAALKLVRQGHEETIFVNLVYAPFREGDGTISGIIAVALDVTEQVMARLQIQESAQRLSSFVESAPFPIGVYIGKEMRIELVNQSIIDVWGKGSDLVGKRYAEVLPELEGTGVYDLLEKVYNTGVAYHARNQQVNLVVDGVLRPFFFNYSFTPLKDANGKTYGVMNTAADVTDLMVAQQKIAQSERNFRNMVLQAPVAMCILLGPDHVVDIANEMMVQIWGKPKESVLHKPIFEGLPDAREQGLENLLDQVYQTGVPVTANERPVHLIRNGVQDTVYQNFVYEPYRDADGTILGILAISIDVTAQVLARQKIEEVIALRTGELAQANATLVQTNQELQRLNINLEEFAYAASHDMKEPVRKILFFADLLKLQLTDKLDEKQSRYFGRLEGAARRMATLIDDLLAYSQATKGIHTEEEVNLNKKVQLVLEDLELEVQQKAAQIRVGILPTIKGNKRQLQQLFQNLISNALKYHKAGASPEVEISARIVEGNEVKENLPKEYCDKRFHLIEVRDEGIGFDPSDAERIFHVFTRLHGNAEYKGTGVGLSIVRKVAENHGGMVWGESALGSGTVFKVLLPVD